MPEDNHIDPVSQFIGSFSTRLDHLEKMVGDHHVVSNNKLDNIIDGQAVLKSSISKAHRRIDGHHVRLQKTEKTVRSARSAVYKVAAAIVVLAGGGGLLAGDKAAAAGLMQALLAAVAP